MDLRELQGTDDLMNEGVWMRYDAHGAMVKLRHTYSRAYTQAREAAEKKLRHRNAYRPDKELSTEETNEILQEATRRALLVDWKNFTVDGAPVEFSEEAVEPFVKIPSFLLKIITMASDETNYHRENLEVLAGN